MQKESQRPEKRKRLLYYENCMIILQYQYLPIIDGVNK